MSVRKSYDISELGLSEGAVRGLVTGAVDVQILNRLLEHRNFPKLIDLIRIYFQDTAAKGITARNQLIEIATASLSDLMKEHPEHRAEAKQDLQLLNAQKMGEHEAEIEKIKNVFLAILRDIKKDIDNGEQPGEAVTAAMFQAMRDALAEQKQNPLSIDDVAAMVAGQIGQLTPMDEETADLFKQLAKKMMKGDNNMPLVKHDYPVLEYDTASKAVFQPGNGKKCFPAKAVFAFLGDEVENYAHTHDGIQIDEFESATRRYPIYECLYNQEKICLCPAPVGSAAAVQVLEYLIAGGVTKIISVGSCGVLEDIPENRFLIPVSALRDEGTSYHYLPPSREVEISKAGINAIESALSQKNIPYWEVKTWTTDGFYRETVEMVQYRKEEGCQVVEMECSALAACAKFRKVTWAMLLFSADTLADPHKYQEREWGKTSISIALELALDAVLSVVEE